MYSAYPPIPVHYISHINTYLESKGINTDVWLKSADLNKTDIIEDRISLKYPVYQKLIESAIHLVSENDFGLRLGGSLSINSHGVLGFALLNCASLRDVLDLFSRYLTTRTPLLNMMQIDEGNHLKLELIELYDITPIRRCFLEVVVVTIANVLNMMLPESRVLLSTSLPYPSPDYQEAYQQALECPVYFGQASASLLLNKALLDAPLPRTDQQSFFQAKLICEQELLKVNQLQSLSSQVRLLLMNSREHFLSLQQVADKLNVTPRTLHRRLEKEQSSFQSILEDVRFTLAKQYLLHHQHSVKQVAYLLGYADVANFRRAFKRWQGNSPSAFRQSST